MAQPRRSLGALAGPDRAVAGRLELGGGEGGVGGLQLLQADDVGARVGQPGAEVGEALDDVVDVEGGDPHAGASYLRSDGIANLAEVARATGAVLFHA